ncbi:GNAT family N-acetyltransferase [Barrientosiimonas humi]|uniref:GNAT family N-acetyltransferase n=1 Tax=Barrientosiimonas humi TaxID=999931 RepID=UPI00370D7024
MIRLVEPSKRLHASWWEGIAEFDADATLHGYSAFGFERADLASEPAFGDWLDQQRRNLTDPPEGFVPATLFWIVDDVAPDRVLGSLHLRHELNAYLLEEGGHIGYGVRPSARGRGVATSALREAIAYAGSIGIDRLLVTCDDGNEPSQRTIEAGGGVLEDVRHGTRRYWITPQR